MDEYHIYDLVARKSPHVVSIIGDEDIYLSVGRWKSRSEIQDIRATAPRRRPRYAAVIARSWARDSAESELWTFFALAESAVTGDPWADLWEVYFSFGVVRSQFYLSPAIAEIRVLGASYRMGGVTCGEDPVGMIQTHTATGSIGRISAICDDNSDIYSRYSRFPDADARKLRCATSDWPRRTDGSKPSRGRRLVI